MRFLTRHLTCPWLSLALMFAGAHGSLGQPGTVTRVILDRETFSPQSLKEFEPLAIEVSGVVDTLIPGTPIDYPKSGIICFEAPVNWAQIDDGAHPAPITLSGPKNRGEPIGTVAGTIRIALNGVQRPIDTSRFIFQLSHELAHVKMGALSSNYLIETFAVAVSFEVLRRTGYQGYLLKNEGIFIEGLPLQIQKALSLGKWVEIQNYWQRQVSNQGKRLDDRPFQTIGALLMLRGKGPKWANLSGIASLSLCTSRAPAGQFQICPPDLRKMGRIRHELKALGFS